MKAPLLWRKGLSKLNACYSGALAAPFTLYRGDEIQGAIGGTADIIRLVRHLRFHLLGLELRIGVSAGAISSGLGQRYAWQMDGSAFHHSRAALEQIQGLRRAVTRFDGERSDPWAVVNAFHELIDTIENRWSAKQWQAVDAYERGGTNETAAVELGIRPGVPPNAARPQHRRQLQARSASWLPASTGGTADGPAAVDDPGPCYRRFFAAGSANGCRETPRGYLLHLIAHLAAPVFLFLRRWRRSGSPCRPHTFSLTG